LAVAFCVLKRKEQYENICQNENGKKFIVKNGIDVGGCLEVNQPINPAVNTDKRGNDKDGQQNQTYCFFGSNKTL
jgi:hypothetical protein